MHGTVSSCVIQVWPENLPLWLEQLPKAPELSNGKKVPNEK